MSKSELVKRWIKIGNAYIMRKIHRLFVKREILEKVIKENEKQKLILEQLDKVEQPYKLILEKVYIQGKSLVTVASEMNYSYRDLCRKNGIALNKFEKV